MEKWVLGNTKWSDDVTVTHSVCLFASLWVSTCRGGEVSRIVLGIERIDKGECQRDWRRGKTHMRCSANSMDAGLDQIPPFIEPRYSRGMLGDSRGYGTV